MHLGDYQIKDGKIAGERKRGLLERVILLPYLVFKFFTQQRREQKEAAQDIKIGDFILKNKNLLVIVCDPKSDKLLAAYKGKVVVNQIRSAGGKEEDVVKTVLKHSTFKRYIDHLILAIAYSLEMKIEQGNLFFQWIDGALFALSKALPIKHKSKVDTLNEALAELNRKKNLINKDSANN